MWARHWQLRRSLKAGGFAALLVGSGFLVGSFGVPGVSLGGTRVDHTVVMDGVLVGSDEIGRCYVIEPGTTETSRANAGICNETLDEW